MRSLLLLAGALPTLGKEIFGSPNGKCGADAGFTCVGSFYGGCCSADGKCGSDAASCGFGCQEEYGWCSKTKRSGKSCPAPKQISCPGADRAVFTPSSGKSYQIECGTEYSGTDLPGSGDACPNLDTCIVICSKTDSCIYALYSNGSCFLKSSKGSSTDSEGSICAHLINGSGSSVSDSAGYGSGGSTPTGSSGSGAWNSDLTSEAAASSKTADGYYGSIPWNSPAISGKGSNGGSGSASASWSQGTASWNKGSSPSGESHGSASFSKPTPYPSKGGHYNGTYSATKSATFTTTTHSGSKTQSASKVSSSSLSSGSATCSIVPKYTAGALPNCKRCDGQPGTDKYCGFDIHTNWYENTPKTCNVVTYNFDVTEGHASPDGVDRFVMLVNDQFPGPEIRASWGDTIVVTVNNKLSNNGTSIHFHGMRQENSNGMDGVPSITQCPIAPGDSMTYTFIAEHYGTSWYHSHFAIQAWEGVHGAMLIDGPTSAAYDVDLGAFFVADWSHFTVDERYDLAQNAALIPNGNGATYGGPVTMDNGLINGKNVWNGAGGNSTPVGARLEVPPFEAEKSYLLRFINAAIQSTFKIYLDGHTLTVIATDFVPVTPYETQILNISPGQRYEVIVKADQNPGNYWLRADNQNACAATVQALDIKAIVRYEGAADQLPTSTAYSYTGECVDEPMASLVPIVPLNAGPADVTEGTFDVIIAGNDAQLYKWYLSGTTFQSHYGDPTLVDIAKNNSVPDYSGDLLINLPNNGTMVYVIIESVIPLPHPIHLHGHDFLVLGQGTGSYSSSSVLQLQNPPRRDTALMPGAGWLVVGFVTDNPGVWLMHCHIGWHTSMGFALQFVEMQDSIKSSGALKNSCELEDTCSKWNTWAEANGKSEMEDSGV